MECILSGENMGYGRANNIGLDDQMIAEIFELIHKYSILTQTKIIRN